MATDVNPTYDISPLLDFSQSDFLGGRTILRSTVKIPKEQKKLLDKKESWAHEFCRQNQRFNVPPEVVQNLKIFLSQRLKAQNVEDRSGCLQKDANVPDEDNRDSQDESDKEETQTRMSWSQSPEHHHHRPQDIRVQVGKDDFLTQPPPKSSPPRPSAPASQEQAALETAFDDQLRSSQVPEYELELEVPSPLGVNLAPVNKVAQQHAFQPISATPPSAQIVPCTYEQQDPSSSRKDIIRQTPKRPIYKKVPELYHPSKSATATSLSLGISRLGSSKPAFIDVQSSITSTTDTSSSIVPATHRGVPTGMDRPSPESSLNLRNSAPVSSEPTHAQPLEAPTGSPETSTRLRLRQDTPEVILPPSPIQRPSPREDLGAAPTSAPKHQSPEQLEAPFTDFALNYPSYTGSIGDFVTACMYLQTLVGKRKLRPFLFDDFIRAWSEGYLPYVREYDESKPSNKALTAIEWFNQIDEPPIYTKQVVTKPTLETILDFYPEEAISARGILRLSQKGTPENASKASDARKQTLPTVTGPRSSLKSINRDYRDGAPTVTDLLDKKPPKVEPPRSSIPATSSVAHQVPPSRALPPHKSMSELERRPQGSTGLSRSFSEAAPQKRKQSDTFQLPPPKKLSTSFVERPTSSSGGSVHSDLSKTTAASTAAGSVMGSRRRFADDPEKRRKYLAQHMKKFRKQNAVPSSAPANNTPTSGQKQP